MEPEWNPSRAEMEHEWNTRPGYRSRSDRRAGYVAIGSAFEQDGTGGAVRGCSSYCWPCVYISTVVRRGQATGRGRPAGLQIARRMVSFIQMEIVQGVHKIPGSFWSALYLIESRDSLALVDAGSPGDGRRIEEYLRSIGRDIKDIEYILVTHSHPDHTGSAFALAEKSGARVAAHRLDSKVHPDGEVSLSYMGVFTSVRLPIPYLRFTEVTDLVSDGDVLPIGDGVRVIHTPGHTPGSLCFMDGGRKLLFSGDTLFSDGDRVSRSVPFPGYDGEAYRHSLNRLANEEFDTLCGGHGRPLVGGATHALRSLLKTSPDPPTWGTFFKSMPRRLWRGWTPRGEFE